MKILISSGHALHVQGARDVIDEVTEARRVTNRVASFLRSIDVDVGVFHDDTSRNQRDNINTIVDWHNARTRDLDVSVHFNAVAGTRDAGIGVETCYRDGNAKTKQLASNVSRAISAASGLILRRGDGTWGRDNLGFLNRTTAPAILLEVCFVNSREDVRLYERHFDAICAAIASAISERDVEPPNANDEPQFTDEEMDILARIVWAEARGEDDQGMALVVKVIMNRMKSPRFPNANTVRDVVFAPGQFTPITNGMFDKAMPDNRIRAAVKAAITGTDCSRGALFFRAIRGAEGSWHETALQRLFDHGAHRFYTHRDAAPTPAPAPAPAPAQPPTPTGSATAAFAVGDRVRLANGATSFDTGNPISAWAFNDTWIIERIDGDRAVLGSNAAGTNNIRTPVHVRDLRKV